jgi:ATP-dependent Lon protease
MIGARMSARELGLFPLGTVLVPGELLPLHIFEQRYKELIADCLEGEQQFVLLYADDEGAREVGTTARVVDVLDRFDDGRMNIVVEGREVVRVTELTRGRSYMTGTVERAEDDPTAGEEAGSALGLYRQIALASGADPDPDVDRGPHPLSYAIAARVEFPTPEKQRILELRRERERLSAIVELLARGLQSVAMANEIERRASTNGKLPKPGEAL